MEPSELLSAIKQTEIEALAEIAAALDSSALQALRSKYTGKKSILAQAMEVLPGLSVEEKRTLGKQINLTKQQLEQALKSRQESLAASASGSQSFDPTLPGRRFWAGHLHPLTQLLNEIKSVFNRMGFEIAEGPEVEDDWHNFEALNHPPHHPARDMQDTFYVSEKVLLRTHTSPVQIRVMEKRKPPVRVIVPGRVYRNEEISARSYCLFHQVEGLYVDEGVSFADLKGTLHLFVELLFGQGTRSRFRPSFFPFTEPSAEMDVECFLCKGKGCSVCKRQGWLEVLGCGMVDPNVFKSVGVDSEQYTGFAFGMGIERLAMLKYNVNDIRVFYENDKRMLEMF